MEEIAGGDAPEVALQSSAVQAFGEEEDACLDLKSQAAAMVQRLDASPWRRTTSAALCDLLVAGNKRRRRGVRPERARCAEREGKKRGRTLPGFLRCPSGAEGKEERGVGSGALSMRGGCWLGRGSGQKEGEGEAIGGSGRWSSERGGQGRCSAGDWPGRAAMRTGQAVIARPKDRGEIARWLAGSVSCVASSRGERERERRAGRRKKMNSGADERVPPVSLSGNAHLEKALSLRRKRIPQN